MNRIILYILANVSLCVSAVADDGIFFRFNSDATFHLNNGKPMNTEKGDCFPFIEKDSTTGLLKLKLEGYYFFARPSMCSLVSEREAAAAKASYETNTTREIVASWEVQWAAEDASKIAQRSLPASSPPQQPQLPIYVWNVYMTVSSRSYSIVIGDHIRNIVGLPKRDWQTRRDVDDFKVEITASSQSEAESKAMRGAYSVGGESLRSFDFLTEEEKNNQDKNKTIRWISRARAVRQ